MPHRAARTVVSVLLAAIVAMPTVAAAATSPGQAPSSEATAPKWAAGRILVGYDRHATRADKQRARNAAGAERATPLRGVPDVEVVETRLGVGQAVGHLKGAKGVRYAQPDYLVRTSFIPDDPRFDDQWGLEQASGIDINAPQAWDVTTGSASTVVAVVDTGIQLDHPDLAGNLWTNPGEIAGNGIDDDDDGYVDDVHGWDFVQDDNVPQDANGHGTHVAGTIAAIGDNGTGVTGVAFGSRVMPLRMLDANGTGFVSDGVRALAFAKAHGVRVANLSWTFRGAISQPLWDVIAAAGDEGMIVTAAAGNDSLDADRAPEYPAAYDLPNIVSVAAIGDDGTLAWFSNHGLSSVDIAAPGEHILSTWKGSTYTYLDGTSMASPHVAGVAALLVSEHPDWTAGQVRDRLLETTHPLAALTGLVGTGGLVDAGAALAALSDRAPVVEITAPAPGTQVQPGTSFTFHATAVDPEDGNVAASISWSSSLQGHLGTGSSVARTDLAMGTHLIVATAHDSAGHRRSATVVVRVTPPVSYVDEHAEPGPAAIAVAPDGTPILSWAEVGAGTIVSRLDGAAWSREVASGSYADAWSEPLVDPSGTVHVAIMREWKDIGADRDGGIVVATDDGTGNGTGWAVDRVSEGCGDDADGCGVDIDPSLAIDGSARLHVAWARVPAYPDLPGNDPGLWHAVAHANGTWTAELAFAADDVYAPDVAIAADGSTHITFWRLGGASDGLYHASDETGDWVVTQVAPFPADGIPGTARVQAGPGGRVDVAWAGTAGVRVRSRISGTWQTPVTVTPHIATDVDLVRDGPTLHLTYGMTDDTGTPTGIGYAVDVGSGWAAETIDAGGDEVPRLAVGPDGSPHISYLRGFPEHEVRHATNDGGGWTTEVVDLGWTWTEPAIGVDAAGHHHVAMGRHGTEPGVWYATDATGTWHVERLTQVPPDGRVALVVAPDGTISIAYAELDDAGNAPLADPAIRLKSGKPGAWTSRRIATNTGAPGVSIARGPSGRLSIAYSTRIAGRDRIAVASDAPGSWQVSYATTGAVTTADTEPSIAIDAAGRVHIAYQEDNGSTANSAIRYVTNAGGSWVKSLVSAGADPRIQPHIALTPAGQPRVAYWIYGLFSGDSIGIRLASRSGTAWSIQAVPSDEFDSSPSLTVDGQGHAHLLWARRVSYAICPVPFCSEAPGLRYWSDAAGFGAPRRVTDHADDGFPVITHGADGSIAGAFVAPAWHLGVVDLRQVLPSATAPSVHLAAGGTVPAAKSLLAITFTGRHAALYRLAQQAGGGAWQTVGTVTGATSRMVGVGLSTVTTRRFRVTAYDGLGRPGSTATGATFRTWGRAETPGSGLTYAGAWTTVHGSSYWGGAARFASSARASVTFTLTAKEIAWVSRRGPAVGDARITIDGVPLGATLPLQATSSAYRQVVYRRIFNRVGTHRITIRPVGNGPVYLDGFLALR